MSETKQVPGAATDNTLTIIARSIGRTTGMENYFERAKDVVRSLREADLSLPQPSRALTIDGRDVEIARLNDVWQAAEIARLKAALTKISVRCDDKAKHPYRRGPQWAADTALAALNAPPPSDNKATEG